MACDYRPGRRARAKVLTATASHTRTKTLTTSSNRLIRPNPSTYHDALYDAPLDTTTELIFYNPPIYEQEVLQERLFLNESLGKRGSIVRQERASRESRGERRVKRRGFEGC